MKSVKIACSALLLSALASVLAGGVVQAQEVAQTQNRTPAPASNPGAMKDNKSGGNSPLAGVRVIGGAGAVTPVAKPNFTATTPNSGPEFNKALASAKNVKMKFAVSASHPVVGPVKLMLLQPSSVYYSSADKSMVSMRPKETRIRIDLIGALDKKTYLVDLAVATRGNDPNCVFRVIGTNGDQADYKCVTQSETSQQHLMFAVQTRNGGSAEFEVSIITAQSDGAFFSATVALAD